jgi:transposase
MRSATLRWRATGIYWKPVWAVLAEAFELVLANAMHVKNVPGRKTEVNDAMWLADLLAHGLIRSSFVPPMAVQARRDLTRARKQLMREKVSHVQRIDKTLQAANLKLGSVRSDIMGASGRAILDVLAQGQTDPERLADQVHTRIRASRAQLVEALRGRISDHQRLLLRIHLAQADATTIPGVSSACPGAGWGRGRCHRLRDRLDMTRFPTAAHLVSWAGLCPRNDESAGKRHSTKLRKGAPWLKTLLVQAAWAASPKKRSYFRALFTRIAARRGPRKAIVAVAAAILTTVYWLLRRGVLYADLGADHFERIERTRLAARLTRKLAELGFQVTLADRPVA